jgi:hypothetical protein
VDDREKKEREGMVHGRTSVGGYMGGYIYQYHLKKNKRPVLVYITVTILVTGTWV